MSTGADASKGTTAVLFRPDVYATASALKDAAEIAANGTTSRPAAGTKGCSAVLTSEPTVRVDKHRRLCDAIEAKKATMLELTKLIAEDLVSQRSLGKTGSRVAAGHLLGKARNPMSTAVLLKAPRDDILYRAGARQMRGEEQRLGENEFARERNQAQLEALVYDLRQELEAAGHMLQHQTEAMRCVCTGMRRMGPHRMIKTHREQQSTCVSEEKLQHGDADLQQELRLTLEKVKELEALLVTEQKRRDNAEESSAEVQPVALQSGDNEAVRSRGRNKKGDEGFSSTLLGAKKTQVQRRSSERHAQDMKSTDSSLLETIRGMEKAHRTARRVWSVREGELKDYIQVLESALTRMERCMPCEGTNSVSLFNLTVRILSCECLLNRRNNGVGFIDPFVVVYSPTGVKTLETLPRDDTNCPQFSGTEDVVTLKVTRGSPWNIVFDVYSRGANSGRLFLGQAKVPVGLLLEDIGRDKETQRSVSLRPREREPDREIVQQAHNLGTLTFTAVATAVGKVAVEEGNPGRVSIKSRNSPPQVRRSISPKRKERRNSAGEDVLKGMQSPLPASGLRIRVAGARAILKRREGGNPNPYVVAYDEPSGKEVLHTPPITGTTNPFWGQCIEENTVALSAESLHGCIIFHLYDHNQDGEDEFLGEARLPKQELCAGKEWHELVMAPRKDEPFSHILEQRHRLGRLLVQCTRSGGLGDGGYNNKHEESGQTECSGVVMKSSHPLCGPFGTSESSEILHEESVAQPGNSVLHPFRVRVTVEACKKLWKHRGKGEVFVRIVAPDFMTYTTEAVAHSVNPSWCMENGSAVISLHPLDPGVIGFHVMDKVSQSEKEERSLGYAQLSVVDLFRQGFGVKELRLGVHSCEMDALVRQRATGLGSIRVSFSIVAPVPFPGECSDCTVCGSDETDTIQDEKLSTMRGSMSQHAVEQATPTSFCMRIYVKEGHNLLDCDQSMFNVLGVTDPRVMVWIGPDHVFTVPEKRDTVNPKWDTDEAEFFVCVQSTQIIRFEVQDVDVTGFDSMGCAAIHASDVTASPGERNLPVMLDGKQYGTLCVVFALEPMAHKGS